MKMLLHFKDYICNETLCEELYLEEDIKDANKIRLELVDEMKVVAVIEKA